MASNVVEQIKAHPVIGSHILKRNKEALTRYLEEENTRKQQKR